MLCVTDVYFREITNPLFPGFFFYLDVSILLVFIFKIGGEEGLNAGLL